jgi:threonine dehydrogenase-like Zn-dependent dehydrogenase
MQALRFDGSLNFAKDAPVKKLDGEALIEVLCAGICNTDLEIVKGYAGFHGILGHEFVGRVIESPDHSFIGARVVGEINIGCNACELCATGDARHCLKRTVLGIKDRDGAFAEYLSLPVRNLKIVPDTVTDEEAVFVEPLAAACQILEQVTIHPAMEVAVIGDGKLAQLIIRALAHRRCDLTVIGKHQDKLNHLNGIANHLVRIDSGENVFQQVAQQTANKKFAAVVEASGSAKGLPLAIQIVKPGGVIVLKSTYQGNNSIDLAPVVVNEIQILGSRCGRFEMAIDLLTERKVDVRPLISDTVALSEGVRAFEQATSSESLKILLRMPAAT